MRAPLLAAADFLAAFQKLLPRGEVWPRDSDAVQTQALSGLMPTMVRQATRAANLLTDAFPATAVELLPEWESTLGLPDPCLGPNPLLAARQAAVVARLASVGGQSIAYYRRIAANLGGEISIAEYAPFIAGISQAGQPLYPQAALFWWLVTITGLAKFFFIAGLDTASQPLWQIANDPISCEIRRLAPGHTLVFFAAAEGEAGPFLLDQSPLGGPDVLD